MAPVLLVKVSEILMGDSLEGLNFETLPSFVFAMVMFVEFEVVVLRLGR